ncbi:MAG TPA: transaldolase [Longimicrobiaceae bacterium]|nr:transaldolase [Longimicrobiaceae bacterium]
MAQNPSTRLHGLHEQGQSVWLDYIRRGIIDNGELEGMIREYDLRGVTSNPSIFEEAIGKSDDYDDEMEFLAADGAEADEAFETLAVSDIQRTCDLFRPIYDAANGHDGLVSMEVSPLLASDTQRSVDEARRLWKLVGRPNLMIKIPGTDEGIPAIEQLLSEGINVNITLLFSLAGYERVMEAFLRGMERRAEAGQPLDRVASVASFFVSRVDTAVDAELEAIAKEGGPNAEKAKAVMGRAAIANAKLAYQRFTEVFSGERWERLAAKGAQVQRPLWASTSTKNPAYRDVIYIESLIGPHTVNTIPLATLEAFNDHGEVRRTVDEGVDQARAELATLKELGIDLEAVTEKLQVEGVEKFSKAFNQMIRAVGEKLARVAQGT